MGSVLAIVFATLCAEAKPPAWLPPSKPAEEARETVYRLRSDGEGYIYDDPRFQARVARDGVVTFKDKRSQVSFPIFPYLDLVQRAQSQGPTLESTLRDFLSKGRRRKRQPEPAVGPAPLPPGKIVRTEACSPGTCNTPDFTEKPSSIEVRGSFDLTDEIMRAHGQDPYAYEKARFLSSTFEMRIKMAIAARKADLKASLESLPQRLEELLGDDRYTPRERRRILYELWYEADDTPEGVRAARLLEDFVRRRLPCGSPQGYAAEELESLRKLHPDRRFAPLADCEPAAPPPP
jgi:hypothetical protein